MQRIILYFCFKAGVRLTMESLWEIANAPEREDEDDTPGTSDEDGGSAHSQNEGMWEECAHSQNEASDLVMIHMMSVEYDFSLSLILCSVD
jgi:hypothetical protein